jgi:methyl-accepting chemotaxis protein
MILLIIFSGGLGYYYNLKSNSQITSMYKERLLPVQWLDEGKTQAKAIESDIYYSVQKSADEFKKN